MRTTLEVDSSQWPALWQAVYRVLEQAIVPTQLRAWIQPLQFLKTENTASGKITVYFEAPNDFSVHWIRDYYKKNIESAFTQVTGKQCEIIISAGEQTKQAEQVPFIGANTAPFEEKAIQHPDQPAGASVRNTVPASRLGHSPAIEVGLDPRYVFDSFVVGASNQFAHASAIAVAEAPGRQYNPLFIYSSPGLGKTHLLHAIGNHVIAKNPNARVAYLSAERFVNELIDSLQHKKMPGFRAKYRDSFDVILIDDIQFIAGKATTEEEFFHTFNALYASKRQIVVTSDRPPKEIDDLEERVRTRFEWGLVANIDIPEIETRIAILKAKAERDDIYLPDDVATFIASHVKSNVRELEGLLIRLQAQSSLTGAEISLEMAKQELKVALPEEGSLLTAEAIQAAVAKHYKLKVADLRATTRARSISLPRQIAMYLIRKYTGLGFKEIGHYFGGKDHTTILHACNKIEKSLESDASIRQAVEAIQNML